MVEDQAERRERSAGCRERGEHKRVRQVIGRDCKICIHREQPATGEMNKLHDTKNKRQSRGQQEQKSAERRSIQKLSATGIFERRVWDGRRVEATRLAT